MKQGETLALNERIMLSLVSTGHGRLRHQSLSEVLSFTHSMVGFTINFVIIHTITGHDGHHQSHSPHVLQSLDMERGNPMLNIHCDSEDMTW